jgi:hypothetical protein
MGFLEYKGKTTLTSWPNWEREIQKRVERGRAQDKGLFTEEPKFPLERHFISIYATETH